MATIRKKDWGYEAQIRVRGRPSVSSTFKTLADARAWAAETEAQIARGAYRGRGNDDKLTLGLLIDRYAVEITPFKKGALSEAIRLAAIRRDPICEIRLSDYLPADMAGYRDRRLSEVSGSTVNRELNLISHVFNVGRKEWGVRIENPVAYIRRPKNNRARDRRLSSEEEAALLHELRPSERNAHGAYLKGGCRNPWMKPLVQLALATAMRQGELLALRWEHVHLGARYAFLPDTKNGDSRQVPLSASARAILAVLPRDPSGRVFPITDEVVKQSFPRAAARAKLMDLHFHDLRHEAVTRMAPLIRDSLTLSKVTGHKSTRMLARYFHPDAGYLAGLLDGEVPAASTGDTKAFVEQGAGDGLRRLLAGQSQLDVANVLAALAQELKDGCDTARLLHEVGNA